MNPIPSVSAPEKRTSFSKEVDPKILQLKERIAEIYRWYQGDQDPREGERLGRLLLQLQSPTSIAKNVCKALTPMSRACFWAAELGATADERSCLYEAVMDVYASQGPSSLTAEKVDFLFLILPHDGLTDWLATLARSSKEQQVAVFNELYLRLLRAEKRKFSEQESLLRHLTPLVSDVSMQGLSLSDQPEVLNRLAKYSSDHQWETYLRPVIASSLHIKQHILELMHRPDRQEDLLQLTIGKRPLLVPTLINAVYQQDREVGMHLWTTWSEIWKERIGKFTIFRKDLNGEFPSDYLAYWQMELLLQTYDVEEVKEILSQSELTGTQLTQAVIFMCAMWAHPAHMNQLLDCAEDRCDRTELGKMCGFILHPTHLMRPELHDLMVGSCLREVEFSEVALTTFLHSCTYLTPSSSAPDYLNRHLYQFFCQASDPALITAFSLIEQAIETDQSYLSQIFSALICSPHYRHAPAYLKSTLWRIKSNCAVAIGLQQALNHNRRQAKEVFQRLFADETFGPKHLHPLLDWSNADGLRTILANLPSQDLWQATADWLYNALTDNSPSDEQKKIADQQGLVPLLYLMRDQQLTLFLQTITANQLERLLKLKEFDTTRLHELLRNGSNICELEKKLLLFTTDSDEESLSAA